MYPHGGSSFYIKQHSFVKSKVRHSFYAMFFFSSFSTFVLAKFVLAAFVLFFCNALWESKISRVLLGIPDATAHRRLKDFNLRISDPFELLTIIPWMV